MNNIILNTDSYKTSQFLQYPPNTEIITSYIEARGGKYPITVFYGLQMFLKEYLSKPITQEMIDEAGMFLEAHGEPFNREGWEYILNEYDGYLPVRIRAVQEGTIVPIQNALVVVENTDPKCFWLTSYIETSLLRAVWYPTTVATNSWSTKQVIKQYLKKTADPEAMEGLNYKLHDFGARGVSSFESAGIGGSAHLVNFMGSDTITGGLFAMKYYNTKNMVMFSVPASEHSTITAWEKNRETDAYKNMIKQFGGKYPIFSVLSDSYDIYNAVEKLWGGELKEQVIKCGSMLVIRPDCYDDKTEILTTAGWKLFSNLTENELVAQVDKDGITTFVKPLKYVKQQYDGDMIRFYNDHRIDLVVTPNHRMVVSNKNNNLTVEEASSVKYYYNKDIPRAAKSSVESDTLSPYERLLIAFQADGSFPSGYDKVLEHGKRCGYIKIRFNFQKKRKEDRLIKICENANLRYSIHREPKRFNTLNQQVIYIEIPITKKLFKNFNEWVDISKVSSKWCNEFIEELSYWDATRRSTTRIKYDTTIEGNAEIVQQLSVLAGYGCTYSIHEDNRNEKFNDIHALTITKNGNMIGGQSIKSETIKYSGKVYCVQVPSGMLLVRRNKRVVVSGNSGNPPEVVSKIALLLDSTFGSIVNKKGYKVLNNVRILQGDGITEESITDILSTLRGYGFSSDNAVFGQGGALLQQVNRDTQKWAMKASAGLIDGEWVDIYKDPITDSGKRSKRGQLVLYKDPLTGYNTGKVGDWPSDADQLLPVFENGKVLKEYTFAEIRERVEETTAEYYETVKAIAWLA